MSAEMIDESFERGSDHGDLVRLLIPTDMPHLPQVDSVWVRERWESVVAEMPHIQKLARDAIKQTIGNWSSESKDDIRRFLVAGGRCLEEDTLLEIDVSFKNAHLETIAQLDNRGYADQPSLHVVEDDNLPWPMRAACKDLDPALFFPEDKRGDWRRLAIKELANKVCGTCEVRPECFVASINQDERYGVWAGVPGEVREPLLIKLNEAERAAKPKS